VRRSGAIYLPRNAWFVSYGLLGLTQNGLVPVLMPLVAANSAAAGLTYAAFSFLGLFAPLLGAWADRTGRHRDLLIWGTFGAGCLLLPFAAAHGLPRILLAAGAGLGVMATTTAGNVLAIQGVPEADWDARVALLQRYVSAGQVIGLVAAGVLAQRSVGLGFVVSGVALLAAGALYCHGARRFATRADQQATAETNGGRRCRYHGTAPSRSPCVFAGAAKFPRCDYPAAAAVPDRVADRVSRDERVRDDVSGGDDS
jgi:MFS family permease